MQVVKNIINEIQSATENGMVCFITAKFAARAMKEMIYVTT